MLGIERSDLGLIKRGLADRLHQRPRSGLYPRSIDLVDAASALGALGATISGAGPDRPRLVVLAGHRQGDRGAQPLCDGWAEVRRVPFSPLGADVAEL